MGSVRIMAVATSGMSFGSADITVPVRDKLIVLPSLPRVIGPGESFDMSVTVFATQDGTGETEITVETEGPLSVTSPAESTVDLATAGEADRFFTLSSKMAAGVATVRVTATAKGAITHSETELAVRPVNPMMSASKDIAVAGGSSATFTIPEMGLLGTRKANVRLSPMPGITFGHRLRYLIRYPYGCMEQTMSAVFPQLYLKRILESSGEDHTPWWGRIDDNINAGIRRLQRFRTPAGGFGYWPGQTKPNEWATNYGGHFLLEAEKLGYFVPGGLLRDWKAFQERMAASESGTVLTRSYRLYLLALAGEPETGAMNLLAEEHLDKMDNLSKWLLAAAYRLAGMDDASHRVLSVAGIEVKPYTELGGTFGSTVRDRAMMLYLSVALDRPQIALELFQEIAPTLGGHTYLSTHSSAFALMAVGNYLDSSWKSDAIIRGRISSADGGLDRGFDQKGGSVVVDLTEHTGRELTIESSSDDPMYAAFEWQGIPVQGPIEGEALNLNLDVRWLDDSGREIDPTWLAQGTVFWGHFRVGSLFGRGLENLALIQIAPSGWEIDATRLRGEENPAWASRLNIGRETYLDIRDDRVIIAVTPGRFVLAPTSVEAMYDNDFRAFVPGGPIRVGTPSPQ
jgi:uncharacterized protein YfaS (alpha-2-macroglobulin family)